MSQNSKAPIFKVQKVEAQPAEPAAPEEEKPCQFLSAKREASPFSIFMPKEEVPALYAKLVFKPYIRALKLAFLLIGLEFYDPTEELYQNLDYAKNKKIFETPVGILLTKYSKRYSRQETENQRAFRKMVDAVQYDEKSYTAIMKVMRKTYGEIFHEYNVEHNSYNNRSFWYKECLKRGKLGN